MIIPILQRRKVSLRETAVWSRPGFGLVDQGVGRSGRQERQPVGTASPAWPGPGKSRDGRPVARQQARNGVGGGGGPQEEGEPAVDHRPSCEGASGEVGGAGRAGESPHRAPAFSAHPPTPPPAPCPGLALGACSWGLCWEWGSGDGHGSLSPHSQRGQPPMESAPESVRVTREVTQCGPSALAHVTHSSCQRRTEASRPFHVALSSVRGVTWGAGSGGHGAFLRSPRLRPAPRDPATALGKTTGEIEWKRKSATRSLLLPRARPPPRAPREGLYPGPGSQNASSWACPRSGSHRAGPSPGGRGPWGSNPSLLPFSLQGRASGPGKFQASLYRGLAGHPGQVPPSL